MLKMLFYIEAIMKVKIRSIYTGRESLPISFEGEEIMTKQEHRDECDINLIMRKYQQTGTLTHVRDSIAQYGIATAHDFHESMNVIAHANSMFNDLPSELRARFSNDPGQFLSFLDDSRNRDEAVSLGLIDPPKEKSPPSSPKEPAAGVTGDTPVAPKAG